MKPKRPSLTHQTVSGMLWMTYGKVAFNVLQLVVVGILARLLTPTDFGVVSAALIVIGLSSIISQLGVGPALVQRTTLEQRHLDTGFTASVLLGALLGGLIWLTAPLVARFMHIDGVVPVLRVLAWTFPLTAISTVASSQLSRDLQFRWLANVDVFGYSLGFGAVGIAGAYMGLGVWALVAGQMAQSIVRSALLLYKRPPRLRFIMEREALKDLLHFGSGFTIARLANYVALYGDNTLTGRYLGSAALGYYGRAYSLMSAPAYAFGQVLDQVLFPAMAKVQDDAVRLAAAYRRGVALIALVVTPAAAVMVFLGPEFIRVALGPHWAPAVAPFQILGLGMLFRTSYKMSDSISRSTGAVYRRAWRQIIYAALVCVGAYIGKNWGIVGVATGSLTALTINFLLMAQLGLEVGHLTWGQFWGAHRPAALLTIVGFVPMAAVTIPARHYGLPALAVLLLGGGALAVTCVLCVWLRPSAFLGADGQWMLDTLRSFLRKLRPAARTAPSAAAPVAPAMPAVPPVPAAGEAAQ